MRSFHHNYKKKVTWTRGLSTGMVETQVSCVYYDTTKAKQSKHQCYENFEAALKVERIVLVLTQGQPDSKRGAPNTSQPGTNQSSRKKGKKWTDGRGSGQGVTFSQGSVRSPAAQEVVDL